MDNRSGNIYPWNGQQNVNFHPRNFDDNVQTKAVIQKKIYGRHCRWLASASCRSKCFHSTWQRLAQINYPVRKAPLRLVHRNNSFHKNDRIISSKFKMFHNSAWLHWKEIFLKQIITIRFPNPSSFRNLLVLIANTFHRTRFLHSKT